MNKLTLAAGITAMVWSCAMEPTNQEEYRQLNLEVAAAVDQHEQTQDTTTDDRECREERARYQAEVRPRAQRMRELSGGMGADRRGMCDSMMRSLDEYQGRDCGASTEENRRETRSHCDRMRQLTASEEQRDRERQGCTW